MHRAVDSWGFVLLKKFPGKVELVDSTPASLFWVSETPLISIDNTKITIAQQCYRPNIFIGAKVGELWNHCPFTHFPYDPRPEAG